MSTERSEIRIEMMSNPLYLSGAREMVSSVARRLGFSDEACGHIALAVDEALCNVIRHGYGRASDRPIWIGLVPLGGVAQPGGAGTGGGGGGGGVGLNPTQALKIVIEDEAKQVDPEQIKSRNLEEVRPGGLGVHIIKAVMDEVKYERRESTNGTPAVGMRLTMIKKRQEQDHA